MKVIKVILLVAMYMGLSGLLHRADAHSSIAGLSARMDDSALSARMDDSALSAGMDDSALSADTVKPAVKASPEVAPTGGCPAAYSLGISASATTICPGTSVTFTVSSSYLVLNGGLANYAWYVNGSLASSGSTSFATTSLTNGASVHCVVTINEVGCTSASVTSNSIAVAVTAAPVLTAPVGLSSICQGGATTYTTTSTDATSYTWTVSPTSAGSINGTGTTGTMSFASGYSGTATISVTGTVCTATSPAVSATVTVKPTVGVPAAPSGSTAVCQGATTTYTTSASNASSYNWTLNGTAIAGTGTSNTITMPGSLTGAATIGVSATGCGTSTVATTAINVTPTVVSPAAPSGSTQICQGSSPLVYTTGAVASATGYTWSISPSSAGSISGSSTSGTVTWSSAFSGAATIGVASAGCNATGTVVTTPVTVQGTVGAPGAPSGAATVSNVGGQTTYTTTAANATGYNWSFSPVTAGSLVASGNTAVVTWNPQFTGSAVVSASANGCSGPTAAAMTTVTVYQPLAGGTITPGALTITSGTDPGLLTASTAINGNCGGNYSYLWQSSSNGVTFSTAAGTATAQNYDPGVLTATTYFRRVVTCGADVAYTNVVQVTVGTAPGGSSFNFVRTRTISKPLVTDTVTADGLTSPYDVLQSTQYLDGLGRPVQTVSRQITPLGKDLVQMQVYDPFDREAIHYLPYAATTSDGNYKTTAPADQNSFNTTQFPGEQYYYGQTDFEPSPLNRPLNVYAAGQSWVGSGRGVSTSYDINLPQDSVIVWLIAAAQGSLPTMSGFYSTGQLYKNVTTDEAGHQAVEFKDKDGLVILRKVQSASPAGAAYYNWLCTYYVYDNNNLLRFVISPQAVVIIDNGGSTWTVPTAIANNYCYRYEYDYRNRMIIKKVPGAGEVHMVYDQRDRLVMSQDSMQRSTQQWLVTTYDTEDRPDSVGLMTDAGNSNNLGYHTAAAMASPTYPPVQDYPFTVEIQNHYDGYGWVTALNSVLTATMDTSYNSNNTYFITSYNSSPVYAVANRPYMITRGMVTGETRYLLGTNQAQYYVNFYDDRARPIEVQSTNYTRGVDKDITQYDFSGKPLRHLLLTAKNGNNSQTHTISNQYTYDAGFRMTGVKDNIDGTLITVDTMQYDELGQLQKKTLGSGMDSLVYAYNVRGWVTGINKNFVAGTSNDYFGLELAYDHQNSVSTTTYAAAQYTGNITGLIWKSAGDGINRKYDFAYDTADRLTTANFLQNPSGSTWNTAAMKYTMNYANYDANGNLMGMNQYGFKIGAPTGLIDELQYHYLTNSNQLSYVIDVANDTASTLGDYHYKTGGPYNYTYDGNGSLKIDLNKGIDSIGYNYLNLPQYVHFKGKGMIQYAYDTKGEKQAKIVTDSTQTPVRVTTTEYIKSCQYTNDTLAQVNIEEGRARWQKKYVLGGDSIYSYFYDYFLKDHLGNTRVILTTQKDTTQYIATMEPANRATENALFYNIDSTSYYTGSVPGGYPGGTDGGANDSVAMVSGSPGDHTQGPAMILKVMAGDSVSFGVNSYFVGGGTAGATSSSLTSVLSTLAGGLVTLGAGGGEGGTLSALNNTSGSPVFAALNNFLPTNDPTPASTPKAYLNWMLLDNQFNYVSGYNQSGALPVGSPNVLNTLATTVKLHHSGYLYIWVSNETQNWMVFFDNLSIEHFSGPMLEENHYYPFGLAMAGISDKALKTPYAENKYRFNKGSELQHKEFSDGTGWEMYETPLRSLDPQLGRWWQVDPVIANGVDGDDEENDAIIEGLKSQSPYAAMDNNPARLNDPNGDCPTCILGAIIGAAVDYGTQVAANYASGSPHPWTNNINLVSIGTAAVAGALTSGGSVIEGAAGKAAVKLGATIVNNVVEVKTSKDGLEVKVEKNLVNVAKNTLIDVAVDKGASKIGSKTVGLLSKIGVSKSNITKAAKSAIKGAGGQITRKTNQAIKETAKKVIEQAGKAAENTTKALSSKAVDKAKAGTNLN